MAGDAGRKWIVVARRNGGSYDGGEFVGGDVWGAAEP
jgi:hypothetical protein